MNKPLKTRSSKEAEKAPDEIIQDLIHLRKLQQEALIKIKTSMEKKDSPEVKRHQPAKNSGASNTEKSNTPKT